MFLRSVCFVLLVAASSEGLLASSRSVGFASKRAERVEEKKFDKKEWAQPDRSPLQNKSFPITEWNKHYSALGSKRAPITVDEKKQKERFEAKVIEREVMPTELSRWNEKLADLHKQAGVSLDDEANITAERKLYHMMLQDTERFEEMGESLSLRDINRFQFRSNRSEGAVPVQKAGEGQ